MKKKFIAMVVAYAFGEPLRHPKPYDSTRMAIRQLWHEGYL